MVVLGKYIVRPSVHYKCWFCSRNFLSRKALTSHCRFSSRHAWCRRCSRPFRSEEAKAAHLLHSSTHWICDLCEDRPDFHTEDVLDEHMLFFHRHDCKFCDSIFSSPDVLKQHTRDDHNACDECNIPFSIENNCRMVRLFSPHLYFLEFVEEGILLHRAENI